MTEPQPESGDSGRAARLRRWREYAVWLGLYLLLALVIGGIAALVWVWGTQLPSYLVRDDGSATISERGLTEFFSSDAVFVLLGLAVGALLGYLGWRWLRGLGWGLPVVAAVNALVAALVCWGFGVMIGPGPLAARLEHAKPSDLVPIRHELHAQSALAVWPFAAALLLLLLAALTRDPEEGLPAEAPGQGGQPPGPQLPGRTRPRARRGPRKPHFTGAPPRPTSYGSPGVPLDPRVPPQGPQLS